MAVAVNEAVVHCFELVIKIGRSFSSQDAAAFLSKAGICRVRLSSFTFRTVVRPVVTFKDSRLFSLNLRTFSRMTAANKLAARYQKNKAEHPTKAWSEERNRLKAITFRITRE